MVLVDSNILIRFSRGDDVAAKWLERFEESTELRISNITRMELLIGARDKAHLKNIRQFLSRYLTIHINEMISQRASSLIEAYNLSHGLQIADSLIAATALELDCELATINRKDFRFIEDLRLVDYR